jgi:plastocyanin
MAVVTASAALALTGVAGAAAPAAGGAHQREHRRAKTARVAIRGFAYRPPTLRIRRGTKVVFANRDRAPHTATRRGAFDTGRIRSGRSASVRFKRRGVYAYVCTIHPFMHGKIVVR